MNIKNKKIIVFGCQQIAVDCIDNIVKKGGQIAAIVTYELPMDKVYGYASVYDIAKKYKIPIYEPEKINKQFIAQVKRIKPDLILSIYYRKILPKTLIEIPKLGCVNIHPSLLPYYRGPIPTVWALLNGESKIGVTIHYIDEGIDTGPIIDQKELIIKDSYTGFDLNNKIMREGYKLLMKNLKAILDNKVKARKQDKNVGSYYGKFNNAARLINWYKSSKDVYNQVRLFTKPYMGALASVLDKDLIIWQARLVKKNSHPIVASPGKILKVNKEGSFLVSTTNGCLKIIKYEIIKRDHNKNYYIKKGARLC